MFNFKATSVKTMSYFERLVVDLLFLLSSDLLKIMLYNFIVYIFIVYILYSLYKLYSLYIYIYIYT